MKLRKKRVQHILSQFAGKHCLVIGDLILDHYLLGNVDRISPEAPVPVVWASGEEFLCGGAANVGRNLTALGASSSLCGITGRDYYGKQLWTIIEQEGIGTRLIRREKLRPTTLKTRVIAHHQQVVRVDREATDPLPSRVNRALVKKVRACLDLFDAVIIEDYGKGVVTAELVQELVALCREKNKIITVDPKQDHFDYYRHVTALTPNLHEAAQAVHMRGSEAGEVAAIGRAVLDALQPKALLLTLGEKGMMLFSQDRITHIPAYPVEVYDVTGAGDTVIAAFTLSLSAGATFEEAASIANFAAGIVVGRRGAAVTDAETLRRRIYEHI
ncbi:MAG: D-glycero-beta-D-manno-heptose-7-phosphate kinase [Candidatus Omnitrophica bacterium]|nr:D-glycero-beta-D-manno-heptose-7-phosphate kinase [Candidatus Omnitrophota bacterium]